MTSKLSETWRPVLSGYTETGHQQKHNAHKAARAACRKLARALMLPKNSFKISTNYGGPAVSGETTLHTTTFYLQISQSCLGVGREILFRACNGLKDYSGRRNHFTSIAELDDPQTFALKLRSMAEFGLLLDDEELTPTSHNNLAADEYGDPIGRTMVRF